MSEQKPEIPSAEQIRAARQAAGLSQTQAGALVYVSRRAWGYLEAGESKIDPARWELFRAKIGEIKIKPIRKADK